VAFIDILLRKAAGLAIDEIGPKISPIFAGHIVHTTYFKVYILPMK
jgi:hypothetical protein